MSQVSIIDTDSRLINEAEAIAVKNPRLQKNTDKLKVLFPLK